MAVALYARVSTTRQAENDLSIPDQLKQMREWCNSNGYLVAREYVEPGASATDDRRPQFQQMIADASLVPAPFEAVVVHSLSRFFRDAIQLGLYEKQLKKAGVKLISITQLTSEDASGEMARQIFAVFDEYQSKENAKHTLRAMKENARQGFFNGARPPFGYKTVEADVFGNRGRKKKKLAIEPVEANIVKKIYKLYLNGHRGKSLGMKGIANLLNEQGHLMRGNPWRVQKINEILASSTYTGMLIFNHYEARTKKPKPRDEWVYTPVPEIIDETLYERVVAKREAQSPSKVNPKILSSPIFLSGMIKCGSCGAGMTLLTGKSGQYRYYQCTTRKNKSVAACDTPNIPMEKLDQAVRRELVERIFTVKRVRNTLVALKKEINAQNRVEQAEILELSHELRETEKALERLYEGAERGVLDMDEMFASRVRKLKVRREEIVHQTSAIKRRMTLPTAKITSAQVEAFCTAMKAKFNDPASEFGKGYIKLLIDEVRVDGDTVTIRGSKSALVEAAQALNPENSAESVPTTMQEWRPREDSNLRPAA